MVRQCIEREGRQTQSQGKRRSKEGNGDVQSLCKCAVPNAGHADDGCQRTLHFSFRLRLSRSVATPGER